MLVYRIIGNCPGCHRKSTYGNVMISRDYVLRGCLYCKYSAMVLLPALPRKKVCYLDQNFLSAAFRGGDSEMVGLVTRLKQLAAMQLLTIPISSIHEKESRQWIKRDEMLEFIKRTSRGHEFKRDYEIEQKQIYKSFSSWLNEGDSTYVVDEAEALDKEVHDWDGYFTVDVKWDRGDGAQDLSNKKASAENLVNLFNQWRNDASAYSDDFNSELGGVVRLYYQEYEGWVDAMRRGNLDRDTPMLKRLQYCLPDGFPPEGVGEAFRSYFLSAHFAEVPVHRITCSAHATLKHDVISGSHSASREKLLNRFKGYYTDLDHIAHYAPYCDIIVVDNAMAELMRKPTVSLTSRYGVQVFSRNSIDKVHEWLDKLEASMSAEHVEALELAYG